MTAIQKQSHIKRIGSMPLPSTKSARKPARNISIHMSAVPCTSKTINEHSMQQQSGGPNEGAKVQKYSISQQAFNMESSLASKKFRVLECGNKQQLFGTESEFLSPKDIPVNQSSAKRQLFCNVPSTSNQISQVQRSSTPQLLGAQSGASSVLDGSQYWDFEFLFTSQECTTTKESPLSVSVNSFCRGYCKTWTVDCGLDWTGLTTIAYMSSDRLFFASEFGRLSHQTDME